MKENELYVQNKHRTDDDQGVRSVLFRKILSP